LKQNETEQNFDFTNRGGRKNSDSFHYILPLYQTLP